MFEFIILAASGFAIFIVVLAVVTARLRCEHCKWFDWHAAPGEAGECTKPVDDGHGGTMPDGAWRHFSGSCWRWRPTWWR